MAEAHTRAAPITNHGVGSSPPHENVSPGATRTLNPPGGQGTLFRLLNATNKSTPPAPLKLPRPSGHTRAWRATHQHAMSAKGNMISPMDGKDSTANTRIAAEMLHSQKASHPRRFAMLPSIHLFLAPSANTGSAGCTQEPHVSDLRGRSWSIRCARQSHARRRTDCVPTARSRQRSDRGNGERTRPARLSGKVWTADPTVNWRQRMRQHSDGKPRQ